MRSGAPTAPSARRAAPGTAALGDAVADHDRGLSQAERDPGHVRRRGRCRLLPEQPPAEIEALLRAGVPGEWELEWIVSEHVGGTRSPLDTPLWGALQRWVELIEPGARLAPIVTAGFADSHYVRKELGSTVYGFFPLRAMDTQLAASLVHSADERIAVDDLELGVDFFGTSRRRSVRECPATRPGGRLDPVCADAGPRLVLGLPRRLLRAAAAATGARAGDRVRGGQGLSRPTRPRVRGHRARRLSDPRRGCPEADPGGTYVVGDAAALPFEEGTFDLVVSYNSLIDLDDMPAAVVEAGRVLRPGGAFCACVPHPFSEAGEFTGDSPDAAFVVAGSYLEESTYEIVSDRGGIRFRFRCRRFPLSPMPGRSSGRGSRSRCSASRGFRVP